MKPTATHSCRFVSALFVVSLLSSSLAAQSQPSSAPTSPTAPAAAEAAEQPAAEEDTKDGLLQDAIEKMMCTEFSRLSIRGYLHQGFTLNPASPHDRQNFGRLFDDRSNDYRLNQFMLTLEQTVDSKKCLDWGFKAQFGLGSDARFTTLTGPLDNVTDAPIWPAINELNATLHWHAGINWDLKIGTYPSLCGLEAIDPTANLLYSHTYIFNFGVPFAHMGFMLFAQVLDDLQLMAGLDRGINIGLDDNNDAFSLHAALIGKLFCDKLSYTLAAHYGPEDPSSLGAMAGFDADHEKRLILDLATTWNVNDCWTLMGDFNYGHEEAPLGIGGTSPEWYGAAGYVVYHASKKLDFILRAEVFRDADGFAVAQFAQNDDLLDIENGIFNHLDPRTVGGGSTTYYALTFGVNIHPWENLSIQTEVRYDRAGSTTPFNDSSDKDQLTFGFATLITF